MVSPQYYIVDGSGNDPIGLTKGGWASSTSRAIQWLESVTQVEESASGGFEVLWSHNNGNTAIWKTDATGNYQSDITATIQHETMFGADLDADGHIGIQVLEAIGDYSLGSGFKQYYIIDGSGNSIDLTKGGALVRPGPSSVWKATQVEESASGGFEVLWSHNNGNTAIWKTDATGNYQSDITATIQHETMFGADLDADGHIGIQVLEAIGDYSLGSGFKQYYIIDGSGNSIDLTKGGALVRPGPSSVWKATQVEESASGGFEVLWSHNNGNTAIWKTDATGNYQSDITATIQHETMFGADLDADGHIGIQVLEAIGDYSLGSGFKQYYIIDGSGNSIDLTKGGALVRPGPSSVWKATQVEESASGGFEVLWSHNNGNTAIWKTDATGNYQSDITATLVQKETTFEVDLNGDGIGGGNDTIFDSIGNDTFDGGAGDDT